MIERLAIEGFRSIRSLVVDLEPLTVVTGANGTGKSSLYRALRLLADCADGRVIASLAAAGGLDAARWAGPEAGGGGLGTVRRGPVAMRLGFGAATANGDAGASGLGYAIDVGLPIPSMSMFDLDASIKQEHVFAGVEPRPASVLVERTGALVRTRGDGGWIELSHGMPVHASVLDELAGHDDAAEIRGVRRELRSWRFHDAFRTDDGSPARRPGIGTRSPRLADDGSNLAAVLQTTIEGGRGDAIARVVEQAFSGSTIEIDGSAGMLELSLRQPGLLRSLRADELSDGTLQLLLLTAALTSIERPGLIVLNEPERSLHAELMSPLADLIRTASDDTQVLVVTHSSALAEALGGLRIELEKRAGETILAGREGLLDQPMWHWPKR